MSATKAEELIVSVVMNVNENTDVTDSLLGPYKNSLPVVKESLKKSIEEYKEKWHSD